MLQLGMTTTNMPLKDLDDRPLLDAAKRLATEERCATAALLRALMEIDSRRLYLGEGCASMFGYCTQVLHLAEGAAYNRIEASRAARDYPVILEMFEQSAITLTAVRLLAPHLTSENHTAVLASARHNSKREVEGLERKRFAETSQPRTSRPGALCSRHIPAAVRRAVWRRDCGRCAFVGAEGRCRETAFLEFHQVEAYAVGGAATVERVPENKPAPFT